MSCQQWMTDTGWKKKTKKTKTKKQVYTLIECARKTARMYEYRTRQGVREIDIYIRS